MFHVVLECQNRQGSAADAANIAEEFSHRPWHKNVACTWDGRTLRLEADNDYDLDGLALLDELSDVITAVVEEAEYADLRVVSVRQSA